MDGLLLPGVGIDIGVEVVVHRDLVMTTWVSRRTDDAGIVPTIGEHEGDVGVGQRLDLVDGLPGRNVIGQRADRKERDADVSERDRAPVDMVALFGEIVVEEELPQIF